jgi:ABC-type nitrate/sulfonate/bicarbonate transport system permease component
MTALARVPVAPSRGGDRRNALILGAGAIVALLLIWFVVTDLVPLVPERILPSPVAVVERFGLLIGQPFAGTTLFGHVLASLSRWGLGVLVAAVVGVPLGFVLAWVPIARAVVAPVFEILRYVPPFAWIPIAVLWFGANTISQGAVVFIAAFPAIVINSRLGVSQADPLLAKAAASLGAGSARTLVRVIAPVAAPAAFTGLRIGFGNGWMALVGAELVVGNQGLGNLILQGQANQQTPTILVGMISIGLIATLFDLILQRVQRLAFPWRAAVESAR